MGESASQERKWKKLKEKRERKDKREGIRK